MKITYIIGIFLLLNLSTFSQTFEWANNQGGSETDIGKNITTEANGNNYFTGEFSNDTLIFANDTLITNFGNNLVVGKHSAKGAPIWGYAPSTINLNDRSM